MTRRRIVLTAVVLAVLAVGVLAAPAAAMAAGYTAGGLKIVTSGEDSFYNYDYDRGSSSTYPDPATAGHNDWPVTIVFTKAASVSKVRTILKSWLSSTGSTMYARISDAAGVWEWRGDAGRKESTWYWSGWRLVARTKVLHIRLYAHNGDRSHNAAWGDYVLCTTHFDNNELGQTSGAPKWYGMSEDAAGAVDSWFAARGYAVSADSLALGNAEAGANGLDWHPDIADATHRWQCDGMASVIAIP
jgi:hypothetical protein